MSVETYLTQLTADRNTIRAKLVEMGLATNTDKLSALAEAISEIIDQGAVSATIKEGDTYTVPKGYHNGSGTVSGVSGGGSYALQSKTVIPTKKQQSITSDSGYYGLSDVTVKPVPDNYQDVSSVNAAAADVLAGKIIVLADGTVTVGVMLNNGSTSATMDGLTKTSVTIPAGYTAGGTVSLTDDIEQALAAI